MWTPEAQFDEALAVYREVLPGKGTLADRLLAWREQHSISAAKRSRVSGLVGRMLTGIRDRTKRRKHRRKGDKILPLTPKQRRANRHVSKWAFAELHDIIMYQAKLVGSIAIKVDADYTSKACPICGYKDEKNRPNNGLLFICQNQACTYRLRSGRAFSLHADLVGARNIAMRTFCVWQDWRQTGQLSVVPGSKTGPDASDGELKAAKRSRLERYAELRWES